MTNNLTLGLLLLKEGKISRDQLKKALLKQGEIRRFGRVQRLGEVFAKLGILSDNEIANALEMQETLVVPNAGYTALGLMLIEAGLLTPSQVFDALVEQQFTEKRIGEILIEKGIVTGDQLAPFLARQSEDRQAAEVALQDEMKEAGLLQSDDDFVLFDMGGDDEEAAAPVVIPPEALEAVGDVYQPADFSYQAEPKVQEAP